jgi:cell division protein DivIC
MLLNLDKIKAWFLKKSVYFKNKFIVTIFVFVIYGLFIDDNDIFDIINNHLTLRKLNNDKEFIDDKLHKTESLLKKLKYPSELEKYARENKLFKRENEDIFIITYK